ncbi:MAG: response regulator [Gemmatimonadetes bacterium]|nr:response regulator [Gemmatimonadota bacterium]
MRVLVVDDELSIRQVVGDFLIDCGHQIVTAVEGADALRQLQGSPQIDAILSDVRMPRLGGLELLRTVRVRHPGIPVILMTGHGDEEVATAALQEGALDYLKKPVVLRDLMDCFDRLGERRQLEDQLVEGARNFDGGDQLSSTIPDEASLGTAAFLIVTADADCGTAISGHLRMLGHSVAEASSAEGARLLFAAGPIDVMFADVDLPDGDGIDLAQELRATDPSLVSAVIAGHHNQQTLLRALDAGSAGYLKRPPVTEDLQRIVSKVLSERKRLVDTRRLLSDLLEGRSDLQEKVVERERFLRHLIDSAPFGIMSTDEAGNILIFNDKAQQLLKRAEEDVKGQQVTTLLQDPSEPAGFTPGDSGVRRECVQPTGDTVPVLLHTSDVVDAQRRTIARLHVIEDRTEREQMEAQLLQSERLSVLGQMAPRLAHEFKTPLQVVLGNVDIATTSLDNADVNEVRECLAQIGTAVEQMTSLVGQMLDLGKPQESRVEALDLAVEIQTVLETLSNLKVLQACTVVTDFDDVLPQIQADRSQIEQVLRNLIVNAAHALERCATATLTMALSTDDQGRVVLTIGDDGCGISPEDLERIFHPFFTTKAEGTGLGLPIVKTILDRHAATVDVESTLGHGTRFTIRFPPIGKR